MKWISKSNKIPAKSINLNIAPKYIVNMIMIEKRDKWLQILTIQVFSSL